jgi:UDPglucose 6-dehydrogenase
MHQASAALPCLGWCDDASGALEGADAMVVLTEWNAFRGLDMERAKTLLRQPRVIDLRNVYDPADMKAAGFHYVSIGRAEVSGEGGAEARGEEQAA